MLWYMLLDTGVLGLLTNPNATAQTMACKRRFSQMSARGVRFILPGIADYELRREYIRANMTQSLSLLDKLKAQLRYEPIDDAVMLRVAQHWADARQMGKPTAPDPALDGDMILCAFATLLADSGQRVTIATTNTKHLTLFADARTWPTIPVP